MATIGNMIRKDHVKPVTLSPPARFGKPPGKTVLFSVGELDMKLLFSVKVYSSGGTMAPTCRSVDD